MEIKKKVPPENLIWTHMTQSILIAGIFCVPVVAAAGTIGRMASNVTAGSSGISLQ